MEVAVFGGGCFWCTEAAFKMIRGVVSVTPGYAGGKIVDPSYLEVTTGETGHAEVIKIKFDPKIISYPDLLDVFWEIHNPTSLNRQGNDSGTQYRSVIFYTNTAQKQQIDVSINKLIKAKKYENPIVTEIKQLDHFYKAEDYHKNYFNEHNDEPYCQFVITPKLTNLKAKLPELIVES